MAKCSFGKISLKETFKPRWPWGTDLYIRMFYVNANDTEALICAVDSSDTFWYEADNFCAAVSARTGIPADNIWYHELQLHAAPASSALNGEVMQMIAEKAADEVLRMKERAEEFTCDVAEAYAGNKYTLNREQYIAGLGGVTVWAGMRFDENGKPYCNLPERMLLKGYTPDLPAFNEKIPFDNNVDPLAYLFVFRGKDGGVIGTLSRFAAHPDVSVLFELHPDVVSETQYHYDYDWPGYMSDKLEEVFGAPSMYVNGPCADLSTKKIFDGSKTYEKSASESKRIGEEIADFLAGAYEKKHVSFGNADNCKATRFRYELPMRENFPHSMEEALNETPKRIEEAKAAFEKAVADNEPPYRVKQLIDDYWRADKPFRYIDTVGGFKDEDFKRHTTKVGVNVLQLGDYLFVGVPGECLVDMTEWLRATYTGRKTISVDQCGGYFGYMATPRSLTLGGYTYWHSWVTRETIPLLKDLIVESMDEWME